MKKSPFEQLINQLEESLSALAISNLIRKQRMKEAMKEMNKVVTAIETQYKEEEIKCHVPQAVMVKLLDAYSETYDKVTGIVNDIDLAKFSETPKPQPKEGKPNTDLAYCIENTDSLSKQEKVEIMNELSLLPGQRGQGIKLTEKGLRDYMAQFTKEHEGDFKPASAFESISHKTLPFSDFEKLIDKMLPYLHPDSMDKDLILQAKQDLLSPEFVASLKNRSTTVAFGDKLYEHATEAQKVKISEEMVAIQYEDPINLRGQRSITSISPYDKEKFSFITTLNQAKAEQFQVMSKAVSEMNSKAHGLIAQMDDKYKITIGGIAYSCNSLVSEKKILLDQEKAQKKMSDQKLDLLNRSIQSTISNFENTQKQTIASLQKEDSLEQLIRILDAPQSHFMCGSKMNEKLFEVIKKSVDEIVQNYPQLGDELNQTLDKIKVIATKKTKNLAETQLAIKQTLMNKEREDNLLDSVKVSLLNQFKEELKRQLDEQKDFYDKTIDLEAKDVYKKQIDELSDQLKNLSTNSVPSKEVFKAMNDGKHLASEVRNASKVKEQKELVVEERQRIKEN